MLFIYVTYDHMLCMLLYEYMFPVKQSYFQVAEHDRDPGQQREGKDNRVGLILELFWCQRNEYTSN